MGVCCGYGTKGTLTTGSDCLVIPNMTNTAGAKKPSAQCGGKGGLVTTTGTTAKTICSKLIKNPDYMNGEYSQGVRGSHTIHNFFKFFICQIDI